MPFSCSVLCYSKLLIYSISIYIYIQGDRSQAEQAMPSCHPRAVNLSRISLAQQNFIWKISSANCSWTCHDINDILGPRNQACISTHFYPCPSCRCSEACATVCMCSTRASSNCENRQKANLGNPQLSNQFLAQALWPCQGVKNSYAKMDNVKPLRTLRHSETRLKRIIQMSRSLKNRYISNQSKNTRARSNNILLASEILGPGKVLLTACQWHLAFHAQHHGVHLSSDASLVTPSHVARVLITKDTHLLRNILSNCWCGMHRTCNKHPSKTYQENEKIYIKV